MLGQQQGRAWRLMLPMSDAKPATNQNWYGKEMRARKESIRRSQLGATLLCDCASSEILDTRTGPQPQLDGIVGTGPFASPY